MNINGKEAGGSASDQSDLVAEFARAIHLRDASAGAGAEVRVCLSNIYCHKTFPRQAIEYLLCIGSSAHRLDLRNESAARIERYCSAPDGARRSEEPA